MTIESGWEALEMAIRGAGVDPEQCSYESSGLCLDGSRTVTAYFEGRHVAEEFIEVQHDEGE